MRTRNLLRIGSVTVVLLLAGAVAPGVAAAKAPSSATLKTLEKNLANTKHLTYEAVYKSVSGSTTSTVTIAQAPPKSNFSSAGGEVINTGKGNYYCSIESGKTSCLSAGSSNPLVGLENVFSPTVAIAAFSEVKSGLLSKLAGIKATSSSATIGGQPSTCVTVTVHGNGGKYCVTKKGILSYAGTSSSYFELTKFTSSPPASLFSLPSGATTVTLPTGVTLPGGESIP
ncbi:MAG TPA: hypothetical protein VGL48_00370 [Acidimicrobiales bacterium]|jgi:hypothetical protein